MDCFKTVATYKIRLPPGKSVHKLEVCCKCGWIQIIFCIKAWYISNVFFFFSKNQTKKFKNLKKYKSSKHSFCFRPSACFDWLFKAPKQKSNAFLLLATSHQELYARASTVQYAISLHNIHMTFRHQCPPLAQPQRCNLQRSERYCLLVETPHVWHVCVCV